MSGSTHSETDYCEFEGLKHAGRFVSNSVQTIRSVLGQFFACRVNFIDRPREYALDNYDIEILDNTDRGTYIIDNSEAFILGRVLQNDELISAFGIRLYAGNFEALTGLLNSLEGTLTRKISGSYSLGFRSTPVGFGNRLCEQLITHYCAKGKYQYKNFRLLIEEFRKLSSSTFEDNHFTTGLIITRSLYAFTEDYDGEHERVGELHRLNDVRTLAYTPKLSVRFWYLVDGKESFYICDQSLRVTQIYFPHIGRSTVGKYIEDRTLGDVLYGGDTMFRVLGNNEFSITSSDGLEFIFQNGYWRLRVFEHIKDVITSSADVDNSVAASIIEVALKLSEKRKSALLVVPRDLESIEEMSLSSNEISDNHLHIDDHRDTTYRVATSDGATILNDDGYIYKFGCIIDTQMDPDPEITGTGEKAAESLGEHALAIKVSQDGTIKASTQSGKIVV